ncbi:hypothetical protein SDC9_197258 [bioreactor metagenome]|uniref:Uncharacterized protein n=1 Tax=bioreactor metagenome TaxID=1076179 RepID=A0A645IFB4_9ZZZZ
MPGRRDSGQRRCGAETGVRRRQRLCQPLRIAIAERNNQTLGRLLSKRNQLDASHHSALNPAVAEA